MRNSRAACTAMGTVRCLTPLIYNRRCKLCSLPFSTTAAVFHWQNRGLSHAHHSLKNITYRGRIFFSINPSLTKFHQGITENRTQGAVPILSSKTRTSNAGAAEEIGYILWVCCLAFFLLLQVELICLNQFKWSKKAKTERGMENFSQLQHKLWKSKNKENHFVRYKFIENSALWQRKKLLLTLLQVEWMFLFHSHELPSEPWGQLSF